MVEFTVSRHPARKDIFDFIGEENTEKIKAALKNKPEQAFSELGILFNVMNVNGGLMDSPWPTPMDYKEEVEKIDKYFFYRGEKHKLRGIWYSQKIPKSLWEDKDKEEIRWKVYTTKAYARLFLNKDLNLSEKEFLPENFTQIATKLDKKRRDIYYFETKINNELTTVFAKHALMLPGQTSKREMDWFRLTDYVSIYWNTSESELEKTISMTNAGIAMPLVIGHYKAPFEQFFFSEKVNGEEPLKVLDQYKQEIIIQDSRMLAKMCLSGWRKSGFTDSDDKLFDGKTLYLIDIDEAQRDIIFRDKNDLITALVNPQNKNLKDFRKLQKESWEWQIKDAVWEYKNNMLAERSDQIMYVKNALDELKVNYNDKKIKEILTYKDNHTTYDAYVSMMQNTD